MPVRIQRKRTKGWKMPPNTGCVTRPSKWSNQWRITPTQSRETVLRNFRSWAEDHADEIQRDLRGRNLACFCALEDPCHVDILLEIANAPIKTTEEAKL